ncbi:MAG: serine phosphatase RsbU (regulator of sigma subunit)/HAMP domain-containing protein [Crocinitomix sp.]|jgi:serine phosphatase RsbU (regulator of sigma subunit)/HAMP domain-containing protein
MSFRFTIGKKIGTGFGVLIVFIIVVFGATFLAVNNGIETFEENDKTSNQLINVLTPSKEHVIVLKALTAESRQLSAQWVNDQSRNDVDHKMRFKAIIDKHIPATLEKLENISKKWTDKQDLELFSALKDQYVTLFENYQQMMNYLPNISSYDDAFNVFSARGLVDQNGVGEDMTDLFKNLGFLEESVVQKQEDALDLVRSSSGESRTKFQSLRIYWLLGAILIIFAIFIAVFTTNTIVKPVNNLREVLLSLGKGIFPRQKIEIRNDEIGDMSSAVVDLVDGMKKTTHFAEEVGQSNFNSPYQPLSNDDVLGHALLKMRDELAETERILEQKVKERTEEVVRQRDENERQRLKLEDLYKAVTASIRYAKRLQNSILPPKEVINSICPDSFVLYKPKDIVSGDFYWFEKTEKANFFAAVDCTGHGVPGAFMSLVGANGLNTSIREHNVTEPAEILDHLNKFVNESLNKSREENQIRDGMDIALCSIDYEKMELFYAGANNPLYIIRDGEFMIIKADKFAIGSFDPGSKKYKQHKVQLQKGDVIYLFSDGYADQFGGERGKKFLYNRFRQHLLSIHQEEMSQQKKYLQKTMFEWQGSFEQVDDILVVGVRI